MNAGARSLPGTLARHCSRFGPLMIQCFIFEAFVAKSRIGGLLMPLRIHMVAIAAFLAVLALLGRAAPLEGAGGGRFAASLCLAAVMVWALATSLSQQRAVPNLMYWVLWAGNYWVIWWCIPRTSCGMSSERRKRLVLIPLVVRVFCSDFEAAGRVVREAMWPELAVVCSVLCGRTGELVQHSRGGPLRFARRFGAIHSSPVSRQRPVSALANGRGGEVLRG